MSGGIDIERRQVILSLLHELKGLGPLKKLFWEELNYDRINSTLSRSGWGRAAQVSLSEDPLLFAGGGQDNRFHVIYCRLPGDRLLLGQERPVVNTLLREHPYSLFLFSDRRQEQWHFINVKYDENNEKRRIMRRITVGPRERLRTASERIAMLDLAGIAPDLFGLPPLTIQDRHDDAFDVDKVTDQFFKEYSGIYTALKVYLRKQGGEAIWAHDYALQFLNRCMFVYFIQRKGWLGGDYDFLSNFWQSYEKAGQRSDSFVPDWLNVLFFEAFNGEFRGGHRHFPPDIHDILAMAPFLNGGLFARNRLDETAINIDDDAFNMIFHFLESYNFTIAEDSPLDQEVAVDPEMIGRVYEILVNTPENAEAGHDAGIFYTPRTEIDLMCRLALVDNLANHLGEKHKDFLYQFIFAREQHEKEEADRHLHGGEITDALIERLSNITVLDPACGSGSFLVGMLHILDDLLERLEQITGRREDPFERKKRIIGESLYGVDVKEWACHVAELRLWLALVVDAEIDQNELHVRREPLLPHFSFRIRPGDSLVQEVGGIDFGRWRGSKDIPPQIKTRITNFKKEKRLFYAANKGKSLDQLKNDELNIFREILQDKIDRLQEEIRKLRRKLEGGSEGLRIRLDGTIEERGHQIELDQAGADKIIESMTAEIAALKQAISKLTAPKDIPFVWDIAFVEVLEGESGGFDIVIGNPPYVRQELIADPFEATEESTPETRKAYKAKLMRSVYRAWNHFFNYKEGADSAGRKMDAKSDLYIYFYFLGLRLLNQRGSFCFITSNSWLDVGFGRDLQELLLRHGHVRMALDNQVRRSFYRADVNTVIVLLSRPDDRKEAGLNNVARFIMFRVPFEHIIDTVAFCEIEAAQERMSRPEFRVSPALQQKLLDEGREQISEAEEASPSQGKSTGKQKSFEGAYTGNKWGGKYLRAPDIYWTIMEKGKSKLVRLGDIAEVRFGIKTGANEFFYLDDDRIREWGIEEEYLKPVIKSPRECRRILIDPADLKYKIFMCHKDKKDLGGTAALDYIKWGESQGFDERPSCAGRPRWWDLGIRRLPPIISPSSISELPRTFANQGVFIDKRLYEIYPKDKVEPVLLATNAITCSLFLELGSRTGLGEGLLDLTVYELADCLVFVPPESNNIQRVIEKNRFRDFLPLRQEIQNENRKELDNIVFDALGLTQGERDAVYEAVIQLVEARLKKANSV